MAVLKSDRTTMEIKYTKIGIIPDEFEPELFAYMELDLRHDRHWLINPALLHPDEKPFGLREKPGIHRMADCLGYDQKLIQTIQDVLETDKSAFFYPLEGHVSFHFYPRMGFPPMSPADLVASGSVDNQSPEDIITLYIQIYDKNPYSASSVVFATVLEVYRYELQEFVDDLKVEWTQLYERFPQEPVVPRHPPLALDLTPQPVEFYLFQPQDTFGWIDFRIIVNGTEWRIWASSSFPPFDNIVKFFIAVAENHLPGYFMIDEEGNTKFLHARPWTSDVQTHDLIHLELLDEAFPQYNLLFTHIVERRPFVTAFYEHLIVFAETHLNLHKWNLSQDPFILPENLEALRNAIERMKAEQ
jgi:hypothetical protein